MICDLVQTFKGDTHTHTHTSLARAYAVTSYASLKENGLNVERLTFTSQLYRHVDYTERSESS